MTVSVVGTRPLRLPESYKLVRLGYVARLQNGLTVDAKRDVTGDVVTRPYLRVANVQAGRLALDSVTEITVPRSVARRSTLRPGDVLMTEGGDLDKLGRGAVWRGELEGCLHQNHIFAIRPDVRHLSGEYLAYVTQSHHGRSYFESTGTKTTNLASTNSSKIQSFPVPLPSLDEQRRIVKFLDTETSRIDRLLEIRDRQQDCIRQRYNESVRELFADADAAPTRLKFLLRARPRYGVLVPKFVDGGVKFIRVNDLLDLEGRSQDLIAISEELSSQYPTTVVREGDVLVSVVGTLGRATVAPLSVQGANVNRAIAVLRPQPGVDHELLAAWIGGPEFETQALLATGTDSAQRTLGMEDLSNFFLRWPRDEANQRKLAADVGRAQGAMQMLSERLAQQAAALVERRQALITAAVTGQLDVTTARQGATA